MVQLVLSLDLHTEIESYATPPVRAIRVSGRELGTEYDIDR